MSVAGVATPDNLPREVYLPHTSPSPLGSGGVVISVPVMVQYGGTCNSIVRGVPVIVQYWGPCTATFRWLGRDSGECTII